MVSASMVRCRRRAFSHRNLLARHDLKTQLEIKAFPQPHGGDFCRRRWVGGILTLNGPESTLNAPAEFTEELATLLAGELIRNVTGSSNRSFLFSYPLFFARESYHHAS